MAAWIQAHPQVEVVTRDRAQAYAAGIRQGNPEALQVADRFHLLQNLAAALQEVFSAHHQALSDARGCEPATLQDGAVAVAVAPPAMTSRSRQQAEQNRTRRRALYERIQELRQKGWTIRAIATHVGHDRRTVIRYLQTSTFPERQPRRRRRPTLLDPFKSYLMARWQAGCHHAKQLFGEIKSQGFRGQYSIVAEYTSRLRTAQERVYKRRRLGPSATLVEVDKPLTPRGATWLVMKREAKLDEKERQQLARIQGQQGEIAEAITLTQDFASLLRQRQADQLDSWLERVRSSCLMAFKRFANGLQEDYDAVKAGITLAWSNGPVEGQINRLKMLKRQMYGRAGIGLLKQRVLNST